MNLESISIEALNSNGVVGEESPIDMGLSPIDAADSVDAFPPSITTGELSLGDSAAFTLSTESIGTGLSARQGDEISKKDGDGGVASGLPDSVARLVASRGGRVLKGKQRGVSATLQWEGHDDLDLHVECEKEYCYFGTPRTRSMELDVDSNVDDDDLVDHPVENIITLGKSAPKSRFRVSVHHFMCRHRGAACSFTVFVVVDGACRAFTGEVNEDETKLVCEFERGKPFATEEQVAESMWLTAKTALKRNQTQVAREQLIKLLKSYPETNAGKNAKQWLKANPVRSE